MKNIIILFVSSDDFTCLIWGWKTANMDYSLYIYMYEGKEEEEEEEEKKTYINLNS